MAADEIRVIAPAYMWEPGWEERDARAQGRLEDLGYKVTFGKHLKAHYQLGTARAEARAEDFHTAIGDKNVKVVMAYSAGWSTNEMFPLIDWDLVKANPKPVVGFSDVTVLLNAIYAKTGLTTGLMGPNFGTLGWKIGWTYTLQNLQRVIEGQLPLELKPSEQWGDMEGGKQYRTEWRVLQEGEAEAPLLGGNFYSFHLLQGTPYQPDFGKPFILCAEFDDDGYPISAQHFSRLLESILQMPGGRSNLKGMIIGRNMAGDNFPPEIMANIIESKRLGAIPVVSEIDFGHTIPALTLPIGGRMKISAHGKNVKLELL